MDFKKLDKLLDALGGAGASGRDLIITKDGKEVYRHVCGFSDVDNVKPATKKDIYWIYSASKVITCTAAIRLIQEGKIKLDDPVSKYIPEYANLTYKDNLGVHPCQNVMTIEHLFAMTSGLDYNLNAPDVKAGIEKNESTVELVKEFIKQPLGFEPGTRYRYSLSHDVLGAIIEIVTGMPFGEYLKKIIFEPLHIKDMGFKPTEEQKSRIVTIRRGNVFNGTNFVCDQRNVFILGNNYESGGAGLFATVEDYIKILTVLANGGKTEDGYELLKPESIALMEKNHLCEAAMRDFVINRLYGYGWGLCGRVHINKAYSMSRTSEGEFGWDGAAGAYALVDRKNRVAMFFATEVLGCVSLYNWYHPLIRDIAYECMNIE